MRFLIFQHIAVEGLGYFNECLKQHNVKVDICNISKENSNINLKKYDSLWVLGGPMNTAQEEECPWMKVEKRLITEAALERKIPFMGICLGCQFLGEALGGSIKKMEKPEIGVANVKLLDTTSSLFRDSPKTFRVLHWHSYQVTDLPNECYVLAESELCKIQAFSYQDSAFGIQFHVEETENTVEDWCTVPEYKESLEQSLGPKGVNNMKKTVADALPQSKKIADIVVKNFIEKVKGGQGWL